MPKTVFSGAAQDALVETLTDARRRAGLTQAQLAAKVGKDQSYVSIVERSQRRVDVLEFCMLAKAMGADPVELFADVVRKLPPHFSI